MPLSKLILRPAIKYTKSPSFPISKSSPHTYSGATPIISSQGLKPRDVHEQVPRLAGQNLNDQLSGFISTAQRVEKHEFWQSAGLDKPSQIPTFNTPPKAVSRCARIVVGDAVHLVRCPVRTMRGVETSDRSGLQMEIYPGHWDALRHLLPVQ